jgi:hypothetical protein
VITRFGLNLSTADRLSQLISFKVSHGLVSVECGLIPLGTVIAIFFDFGMSFADRIFNGDFQLHFTVL